MINENSLSSAHWQQLVDMRQSARSFDITVTQSFTHLVEFLFILITPHEEDAHFLCSFYNTPNTRGKSPWFVLAAAPSRSGNMVTILMFIRSKSHNAF